MIKQYAIFKIRQNDTFWLSNVREQIFVCSLKIRQSDLKMTNEMTFRLF